MDMKRIVSPETVRMLELGHPWVIADRFTAKWPSGKAGDVLHLVDAAGRFLATALYDPNDRIVARVLSRQHVRLDRKWLAERVAKAVKLRRDHVLVQETDTCRLVNGEGDGLPGLTVDRYGDYLMVQLYTEAWRPYLNSLTGALQDCTPCRGIYEKTRPRNTRDGAGAGDGKRYGRLLWGEAAPDLLEVRENGLRFLVSLDYGLNTGLFLDQRNNRRDIQCRAKGKTVLNLFAYTGSFSVAAAAGGADLVTGVDASTSYTDWARKNFERNGIDHQRHEFLVGDAFACLADLRNRERRYDLVIMDPPSFSTTSRSRFTTRGGTSELVEASLPLLADGGLLVASSNHQKVDLADYLKGLRRGALAAGRDLQVISTLGQAEDFPFPVTFPEGRYLKYVMCVKM